MRIALNLIVVAVLSSPLVAHADGLIYKLPKDGSRIVYEMTMTNTDTSSGRVRRANGTLSVGSVGSVKADGQACRWIEFEMKFLDPESGRMQEIVSKMLIPESQLGKGKNALKYVKRGWLRMGQGKALEMNDPTGRKGGPLPSFLPASLTDVKPLEIREIKTGLGKLKCKGLTANSTYERGKDRIDTEYDIRLHPKAPFGVAACRIKSKEFERKERLDDINEITLTLKSVSQNAKSSIPDKN